VNQLALTKMSTALASWRTRVKKRIDKKESWEEIKKHEPLLEHDDYVLFKKELAPPALLWTPSSCQVIRNFSFYFVQF
jgi:hypothetical protein